MRAIGRRNRPVAVGHCLGRSTANVEEIGEVLARISCETVDGRVCEAIALARPCRRLRAGPHPEPEGRRQARSAARLVVLAAGGDLVTVADDVAGLSGDIRDAATQWAWRGVRSPVRIRGAPRQQDGGVGVLVRTGGDELAVATASVVPGILERPRGRRAGGCV